LTGDHLTTSNGEVILHPMNHATFLINWQGKTIYSDPTNGAAAFPGLPKADLMLVTHAHGDHFNAQTLEALRGPGCVIITSQNVYSQSSMTSALRAITTVLGYGGATNVMGLQVQAVPAYNSYHPTNTGNGYVVTIAGKRIYIAGDTGDVAEMRSLSNIDVAFVPMNIPFTMAVSNAANIVRDFRPKIVYPYHFRTRMAHLQTSTILSSVSVRISASKYGCENGISKQDFLTCLSGESRLTCGTGNGLKELGSC